MFWFFILGLVHFAWDFQLVHVKISLQISLFYKISLQIILFYKISFQFSSFSFELPMSGDVDVLGPPFRRVDHLQRILLLHISCQVKNQVAR
jgi:hypothetical protein